MLREMRQEVYKLIQSQTSDLRAGVHGIFGALGNRAQASALTPSAPSADTITAFVGIELVAKASGLFVCCLNARAAAAAADIVTWTVTTYFDTVTGTPMTLPANAALVASSGGVYEDNSGAGIAPTAGATSSVIAAPSKTIGTAAVDDLFVFANLIGGGASGLTPIARGKNFYVTLSITDSAAARAVSQVAASMFELP